VATQGRADLDQWVTYYKVQVSNDKLTWTEVYKNSISDDATNSFYFKGNYDRGSYVTNMFGSPADFDVTAWKFRYVKITVMDFHNWPSMRAGVITYRNRGCWCAGTYCPTGTVCSHQEGCVAPGDGTTTSIETFGHASEDSADASDEGDATPAGAAGPVGETTSPNTDSDDLWKTWGPVSVLANVLILGCLAGSACVYFVCVAHREGEIVSKAQAGMPKGKAAQWVSHNDFSPRSPGGPAKNESHPV